MISKIVISFQNQLVPSPYEAQKLQSMHWKNFISAAFYFVKNTSAKCNLLLLCIDEVDGDPLFQALVDPL